MIQTEYEFTLPLGFQDEDGSLQREGTMRLATAMDEIAPLNDVRVQNNPAYLIIILLSRVITHIGSVSHVNPKVIESLYAADLAYLQKLFNRINQLDDGYLSASCPLCHHTIKGVSWISL